MTRTRKMPKLIREGDYVAEVEITVEYTDEGWSPYISMDDSLKLDTVRQALRDGDMELAARYGEVFKLTPVA